MDRELALRLKEEWEDIESRIFLPIIAFEPEVLKARITDLRNDLDKLTECGV